MRRWNVKRVAVGALLVTAFSAVGVFIASCVGDGGTETFGCPSQAVFTGVSPDGGTPSGASVSEYMARRCGTLDCHGSELRSMRLYGQYGLREPAESNVSGGKVTTLAELKANYGSVCTVEPEKTSEAVDDEGQSAERLLVVLKARGEEGHKGGAVVKQGSPGDNCIAGWLRGDPSAEVAAACQAAINGL
ncbi:Hypothetical protein A7982_01819 [Minicystis rosea]|nr:Hypothetical protein A7982_01819 [Minicystis rosea]